MAELSSQPKTIQTIYSWYRGDRLFVNRSYQRKLVWTLEEKQKLIDSVLSNYPIPAIILAEVAGEPETYEVIDGLQRLHAILSFIETAFPSQGGKYFDLESFPTARTLKNEGKFIDKSDGKNLTPQEITKLLDYSMATAIMRNATSDEINDVFDRINTYGHRLSNQERRQAGVATDFSSSVREISASLRGDVSKTILPLYDMPSISIDMPMTRHGYDVRAEDVFWVKHGVILAGDLRDSQDEECVADILASIVLQTPINRSRTSLDAIYDPDAEDGKKIAASFVKYGDEKSKEEFKFVIGEIEKITNVGGFSPLKRRLFAKSQGNAFPTIFATIFLALHDKLVRNSMRIIDYTLIAKKFENLGDKLDAGKKGAGIEQRTQNIGSVKGIIEDCLVKDETIKEKIYQNHGIVDIEDSIKRSQIETASYELKSGLLDISAEGKDPNAMLVKIAKTICAIANNGKERSGKLILGVCDKDQDAARVKEVDGVEPKVVGARMVVGVDREAKRLGVSVERYIQTLREFISNSALSSPLKENVLSDLDYNDYFGYGIIVISIAPLAQPSYYERKIYFRKSDQTVEAEDMQKAIDIGSRFQ